MRMLISLAVFLACLGSGPVVAQSGPDKISVAFEQKDSKAIAAHFKDHVQIDICKKSGVFSQAQAERIIEEYFQNHPQAEFKMDHVGCSEKNGNYCVGTYEEADRRYRVSYLLDPKPDGAIIRNLSILEIKSR